MKYWIFFTLLTAFSIYWIVNLVLWFPWSYSPSLGITLMLTVSPLIWSLGIYQCLVTYPGRSLINAATSVSLIYILLALIADYIFFAIIRNAREDLYRPTTFYGYGFLISLPFIILFIFKNKLKNTKVIKKRSLVIYGLAGVFSLFIICAVIKLKILN